ncbi:hypothetical protein ACTFIY_012365 [Dictyostelium cf. discoideum]
MATTTTQPILSYHEKRRILFIDPYDMERIDGYNREIRRLYSPQLLERVAYIALQEPYYLDMFSKIGHKGTCLKCKITTRNVFDKFICYKCERLVKKKRTEEIDARTKEHYKNKIQMRSREARAAEALKNQKNQIKN